MISYPMSAGIHDLLFYRNIWVAKSGTNPFRQRYFSKKKIRYMSKNNFDSKDVEIDIHFQTYIRKDTENTYRAVDQLLLFVRSEIRFFHTDVVKVMFDHVSWQIASIRPVVCDPRNSVYSKTISIFQSWLEHTSTIKWYETLPTNGSKSVSLDHFLNCKIFLRDFLVRLILL